MRKKAKRMYNKKNKISIVSIIQIILIFVMIVSGINIYNWWKENKQNDEVIKKISDKIIIVEENENTEENGKKEEKYIVDFNGLKEINDEVIGVLKVNGTSIEYPVVKHNDNYFYLNHNFEKVYNSAGWIFMDKDNKLDGTDKNIVIYGHNRRNDSMFGTLKNILNDSWYKNEENLIINFITENETYTYKVFSVYSIEAEDYYIKTSFLNNEFSEFIKIIKSRSIYNFKEEVSINDQVLTLSTCANDSKYRIVLHAKK